MRRQFFLGCFVAVAGAMFGTAVAEGQEGAERPNVLFLFTDDQRPDTIHALGNEAIQTPHLDRLAQTGMVFDNAYCMGANTGAVCLPSRTMVMTGLSLFHLKPERNARYEVNFPRALRDEGYVTYHHGKSGNTPHGVHADFDHTKYVSDDQGERRNGFPGKEIADAAIEFLDEHDAERPFFMYLAFGNPHDPRVVNDATRRRYDDASLPLPENYAPLHPFDNGEMIVRDEQLAPWPRGEEEIRRQTGDYYDVITHLDLEIGRILDALRKTGAYERTIIVFSSDHGLAMGSHGLMGKQNLYEHSMQAPLVVCGPGVPAGRSEAMVYLHDIFPTVMDLVGLGAPDDIDGRSFEMVARGREDAARETIFLAYKDVQRAVRRGDWKLIRYPRVNVTQLFNLREDPHELNNLAGQATAREQLEEMTALLAAEQRLAGDTTPLTVADPRPPEIDADELNRRVQAARLR